MIGNQVDEAGRSRRAPSRRRAPRTPTCVSWNAEGPAWGAPDACVFDLVFNNMRRALEQHRPATWAVNNAIDREKLR